jgi:GAF domain-containing protein
MDASAWPAQPLAEFIAVVSTAKTEAAAAGAAVEHAAEALDADMAAIVCGGELVAAVGYREGTAPIADLEAVMPGAADARLEVPGVGSCAAAAAALDHPPGATLVVARLGPDGLSREETGLLRGMAQVAAMTMRVLSVLDDERLAREEVGRLASEQAALRRVATLVAKTRSPDEIFSAVAQEVAQLSGADVAVVLRYERDGAATVVGCWGDLPGLGLGTRLTVEGEGVAVSVLRTGQLGRTLRFAGPPGSVAGAFQRAGVQTGSGSPIMVEGRLWGVVIAARTRPEPLPSAAEQRIPPFTELVATAIANTHARVELREIADEQAALRRVATLVAQAAPPEEVFAVVAAEVGQAYPAVDFALVGRYDPDGCVEVVGAWSRTGEDELTGIRTPLGGQNVTTLVFETNRAARFDQYADSSRVTESARGFGIRSSAGAPISVEGRVWGVMIVASRGEDTLPAGAEHRLAGFTELLATAIANAQAHLELRGYADEQAALRRVATLVARAAAPEEGFATVTAEIGRALSADFTGMVRYDGGDTATVVGVWTRIDGPSPLLPGTRFSLGGRNAATLVFDTGRAGRIDDYANADGPTADSVRGWGFHSMVGVPISVEGRLWGVVTLASAGEEPLPADTEDRLAGFTELVATAIANAHAHVELRGYADEQSALRRVATLVAAAASPEKVFAMVAAETGRLLGSEFTFMSRYDPDGIPTVVAAWPKGGGDVALPLGTRLPPVGENVHTQVFQTGRPARRDTVSKDAGPGLAGVAAAGIRSSVGVPISVAGRLWGVVIVSSTRAQPLLPDTEERLARFTELVATAIANAQARAELKASRVRIVDTADETRRRIERDLHDGAQQQVVSLALQLRAARAAVPPELGEVIAELDRVAAGLASTLDELREYTRGIHPAVLTERGLASALRTLARRSSVPVELDVRVDARLPERVEVAAYYVASEALANATKHAQASRVTVDLEARDKVLRIDIRDDGVGGADPARGTGLVGLKDRVEASGGTMTVRSHPGEGTSLVVELPVGAGPPTISS